MLRAFGGGEPSCGHGLPGEAMKKVQHAQRPLWVGVHPTLGALLYDEQCQQNLPSAEVRLFKLQERETATFVKDVVRRAIAVPAPQEWNQLEPQVDRYLLMVLKQRSTHCYRCERGLDSVNFGQCPECQWLRCECGACGCGYVRRGDED
jgi:hypothetical protein